MGNLFQELKRRKVFKVGATYTVVAWVLIQVSNEVLPTFNTPEWVGQTLTFLLILGFPITLVMAWAYEITPSGITSDTGVEHTTVVSSNTDRKLIYVILALVTFLGGLQVSDRYRSGDGANQVLENTSNVGSSLNPGLSRRLSIDLGPTVTRGPPIDADIAFSQAGDRLVYSIRRPDESSSQLFLQEMDVRGYSLLKRNSFGYFPFISPDGEWIAFWDNGDLTKMSVRAGNTQLLAENMAAGSSGYWTNDDTLYYSSDSFQLMQIDAAGGTPEVVNINDYVPGDLYNWPVLLPDQETLMLSIIDPLNGVFESETALLDLATGELSTLIVGGYHASYVPTGHVVFVRAGSLWAVPFDLELLETIGEEVPIITGIGTDTRFGTAAYAFSVDGLLVYLPGEVIDGISGATRTIIWVDREGNEEELEAYRDFSRPTVSPDGLRLAVSINENTNSDIWTWDLDTNALRRLTFDPALESFPLWSPDGQRIVFYSSREGGSLWWKSADGSGQSELLLADVPNSVPTSFVPDGSGLVYTQAGDLYLLSLDGEFASKPLIQSDYYVGNADISTDGRWIAYDSIETGRPEIYVSPFPDIANGKYQVSYAGGQWPKWSADGKELFYRTNSEVFVSQAQAEVGAIQFDAPVSLFAGSYRGTGSGGGFDISDDGSQVLLIRRGTTFRQNAEGNTSLVAVENWFEELRRQAPPDFQ